MHVCVRVRVCMTEVHIHVSPKHLLKPVFPNSRDKYEYF